MKNIKDELQNIILGDEQIGSDSQLKKVQNFLRGHAKTGISIKDQQRFKDKEAATLITFAKAENLSYSKAISVNDFISEGPNKKFIDLTMLIF